MFRQSMTYVMHLALRVSPLAVRMAFLAYALLVCGFADAQQSSGLQWPSGGPESVVTPQASPEIFQEVVDVPGGWPAAPSA